MNLTLAKDIEFRGKEVYCSVLYEHDRVMYRGIKGTTGSVSWNIWSLTRDCQCLRMIIV